MARVQQSSNIASSHRVRRRNYKEALLDVDSGLRDHCTFLWSVRGQCQPHLSESTSLFASQQHLPRCAQSAALRVGPG